MQSRKELTTYILWQIWKNRNHKKFEQFTLTELDIIRRAQQEWLEFKQSMIQKPVRTEGPFEVQEDRCWKTPPAEWMKINVGIEQQEQLSKTGMGFVARNDKGEVMQIWTPTREGHCSS